MKQRTRETEAQYAIRVRQLYRSAAKLYAHEAADENIVPPGDVVDFLLKSSQTYSIATWRLYRAAVLWHLTQRLQNNPDATAYRQAYERLVIARPVLSSKDNSRKRRIKNTISTKHLEQLLAVLNTNSFRAHMRSYKRQERGVVDECVRYNDWSEYTRCWILATLATGLRPNEWKLAHWQDTSKTILMAPNSKRKAMGPAWQRTVPGRSVYDAELPSGRTDIAVEAATYDGHYDNGEDDSGDDDDEDIASTDMPATGASDAPEFRQIAVAPESRETVDKHLDNIRSSGVAFATYYEYCRTTLWRACKAAFHGKITYSLYTMRSQFAANAKATMPLAAVGTLMGHDDPKFRTTMRNYGPRSRAHGSHSLKNNINDRNQDAQALQPLTPQTDKTIAEDNMAPSDTGSDTGWAAIHGITP